jgi:hypothetical protein
MTRQTLLLFLILLFYTSTIYSQSNTTSYSRTIIPNDTVWTIIRTGKDPKTWTPTKADIIEAERLLSARFLKEKAEGHFETERLFKNYTRQYHGSIDENGKRIIWVNCFCGKRNAKDEIWETQDITVSDGGDCYFNVKIDLKEKKCFDLEINGKA